MTHLGFPKNVFEHLAKAIFLSKHVEIPSEKNLMPLIPYYIQQVDIYAKYGFIKRVHILDQKREHVVFNGTF